MLGNASRAWNVLQRVIDSLIKDLNDNDLDELMLAVSLERARRRQLSRRNPEVMNS
jgi:hypothetical protein